MSGFANQWSVQLPSSATRFQFALAGVDAARLAALDPELITTLWDPQTCPAALLPFLAWALSVDVWDANWPEEVKRAVVAASPMVHRKKGTRSAVEAALDALYASTDITEWWETQPPGRRGTFSVTAFVRADITGEGNLLSARRQVQLRDAVRAAKPKSRVFEFQIGVELPSTATIGAAIEVVEVRRIDAFAPIEQPEAVIELGAAAVATEFLRIDSQAVTDSDMDAGACVGAAIVATEFLRLEGVAK